MSAVKRKLKNTKLIQKCQIIRQIEKEMTNKEKFGVPKNTISTWMKNKDKLFEGLEQSSSDAKKMRGCDYFKGRNFREWKNSRKFWKKLSRIS